MEFAVAICKPDLKCANEWVAAITGQGGIQSTLCNAGQIVINRMEQNPYRIAITGPSTYTKVGNGFL